MSEGDLNSTVAYHKGPRRRLTLGLGAALLLAAFVLTPPLLNANRLSRRIATSMSQSLGRPVHLDQVSLHVLPTPGFTLQNLVVSEDPQFGAEPIIRAQVVNASIRVSSLWRHQVEFGTIHFEDPSVNLVRRADGRWNVESILLHAAQEEAAPTAQPKAGPAPRFPYIEATGARLNLKIGDEKKPFALTEAEFALWLPSPQQWRLRLTAKPTRTDTNVSDTGVLAIEATLERATRLADVPMEITASWRRAPLGEASHMVGGSDMGWRGDVEVNASAHGTLGNAVLSTALKLTHVRRADFIPLKMMALAVECSGRLAMTEAVVTEPACTLPAKEPASTDGSHGVLAATADKLDLSNLHSTNARLGMTDVPADWLLAWAELFSQRIPASTSVSEELSGTVASTTGESNFGLEGEFHTAQTQATRSHPLAKNISIRLTDRTFTLSPINLATAEKPALTLAASANSQFYSFHLFGAGTRQDFADLRDSFPPLGDGIEEVLPALSASAVPTAATQVDIVCTRTWGSPQTCLAMHAPEPSKKLRRR